LALAGIEKRSRAGGGASQQMSPKPRPPPVSVASLSLYTTLFILVSRAILVTCESWELRPRDWCREREKDERAARNKLISLEVKPGI
jgi:hypothetical protein